MSEFLSNDFITFSRPFLLQEPAKEKNNLPRSFCVSHRRNAATDQVNPFQSRFQIVES